MTEWELMAYEARQNRHRHTTGNGVMSGHEHELHEFIRLECSNRGWIALHGAMSHRTHRTKGEPDFIILADGGRSWHVECKTRTGKLSLDQSGMDRHYAKLGHRYHIIRSEREFLELIKTQ
jgi:hypothetical protein